MRINIVLSEPNDKKIKNRPNVRKSNNGKFSTTTTTSTVINFSFNVHYISQWSLEQSQSNSSILLIFGSLIPRRWGLRSRPQKMKSTSKSVNGKRAQQCRSTIRSGFRKLFPNRRSSVRRPKTNKLLAASVSCSVDDIHHSSSSYIVPPTIADIPMC